MKNITAVLVVLSLCAVLNSISPQFGSYVDLGLIEFESLSEASGLVSSRKNAQVFWSHNDSGDESNLYAFNDAGDHLGVYLLDGISARDWEDIATGPGSLSGEQYLYIGDIGDNAGQYQDKYVHRIIEPEVSSGQQPGNFILTEFETITLRYPGTQLHDAETLMIDPLNGDLYIVTKRNGTDHDLVYRAAYPHSTTVPIVMEEIATLSYPAANGFGATAGDFSPSGLEILIKTYSSVYYWSRSSNSSVSEAFSAAPLSITYFQEPQGEALAWKNDGMGYYTVSEEPQIWLPAHLYFYPRLDNYISIINIPTDLYLPDENFTIEWEPSDLFCELLVSSSPGGEVPENYFFSGVSGTGGITSSPAAAELGTGVHYCTLYNDEYSYISYEFQIIAESDQGVIMNEPMNGSMIYDQTPVFSWEENPGVPYYFIVLSDHPFTIEEDENGDPTVTGLQPVWQIITPNNTALYGCPDPSGYFNNVFQPLINGVEYNWIVANNYGNDPLLTSKVVAAPFAFQFEAPYTIPSPQLIYPENNSDVIDGTINFVWSEVEQAMNYHIYLYEVREENGSIGNYLVWDQITT
ncbi:MAG: hypothetical protein JW996_07600, partial [Candidatus Cloacimonetes bacterium]|nr:hypothetical protein [Candidatus Cloacimonadota bacterium]